MIAAELAAWWVVAVGVWMASLSAFSGQDLVVAMACAVPCAAAAFAARRAVRGAWVPPLAAFRWAALLPVAIVVDTVKVLSLPVRRGSAGEFRRVDIGAPGESGAAAGRRAIATLLLSSSPSTYVVMTDPESGNALAHSIGPPSSLERSVGG